MSLISYPKTWASGDLLYAADLEAMKAAITAAVNGGLDDANIVALANIALSKLGDYSATVGEMQTQTDPYPSSVASLATDIRGEIARLRYVIATALGNTYWYQASVLGVKVHTTGDVKWTIKTSADTGWVLMNDGTIGNAASSGSTRANADTVDLFTLIWTNFTDAQCPLSSGTRAGDGTAAASYAANKNIRLPLVAGRVLGVAGTPAAANVTDSYTMTATGGTTTTIVVANNERSPFQTDAFDNYTVRFDGNITAALAGDTATISAYNAGTWTFTISSVSDAPASGDTFTIYRTVTTRALGTAVGLEEAVLAGDLTGDHGSGTQTVVSGFAGVASDDAVLPITPPTYYVNCMVKL